MIHLLVKLLPDFVFRMLKEPASVLMVSKENGLSCIFTLGIIHRDAPLKRCSSTHSLRNSRDLGAQVIGVSADSPESHQKFAEKHNLSILLLSDREHTIIKAYDAWKPKTMFGKEFFGTHRDTFLIDPEGKIITVWRKVSPKGHAEEVQAVLLEKKK